MPFLLLQTFVWMALAGLLGAIAGCLAHRLLGHRTADDGDLATAAVGGGAAAGAVAARTAARAPVVEASRAPAPVTPVVAARTAQSATPYTYPVTTIGIPRNNPERVQPQIETITLQSPAPAVGAPAVATAAAEVIIRQTATPDSAGANVPYDYPITTIGIPRGYVAQAQASVVAAPAVAAVAVADAAKIARAVTVEGAQPRPEPLRPELSRTPPLAPAPPVPAPPVLATVVPTTVAPAAPVPITSTPAAPLGPLAPAPLAPGAAAAPPAAIPASEPPFVPVAVGGAALDALAARAAAASAAAAATVVGTSAAAAAGLAALTPNTSGGAAAAAPVGGDDLMRIRTIDPVMQARLKSVGVTKFADLARWLPSDVARVSQALGVVGRIEQENWIEQAQILATGGETDYSRRRARGEVATGTTVATAGPTVAPAVITGASSGGAGAAATAAAAAMASAAIVRATASVEPSMPAKLVDAIRENLVKPGSAAAAATAAASAPTASPAEASRVLRPDLAGLRSVRSEALRDVTASDGLRSGGSTRPSGSIEDLKRIRGIGVLIEKKLNSLGVTGYEQIANWTNADIDRVSQLLDFKGRIERENWVEQARILATGGQTEFSKRVDRGEA